MGLEPCPRCGVPVQIDDGLVDPHRCLGLIARVEAMRAHEHRARRARSDPKPEPTTRRRPKAKRPLENRDADWNRTRRDLE